MNPSAGLNHLNYVKLFVEWGSDIRLNISRPGRGHFRKTCSGPMIGFHLNPAGAAVPRVAADRMVQSSRQ
jgi:hypothetical protein